MRQYHDMIIEADNVKQVVTPEKQVQRQFTVRVLTSPAGEMAPDQAVLVSYESTRLQDSLKKLDGRGLDRDGMIAFGTLLATLLLPDQPAGDNSVYDLFARSMDQIDQDGGLRLRLRLPEVLAKLPWEYMYVDRAGSSGMDGFLALNPRVAIVRHEVMLRASTLEPASGMIKVVAALASPPELPELNLAAEEADLHKALDRPGIEAVYLPQATLDEVLSTISGASVFHFAGHGVFTTQQGEKLGTYTGSGALALFDQTVDAETLAVNLNGKGLRLAVLGGCETGRREGNSVWSGLAPALIRSEAQVPAVVANQFKIQDTCAIAFSKQLYAALVGGLSIEEAVAVARTAAYNEDEQGRDWGAPVLYLRPGDGYLFGGATDDATRQQARNAAEVVSNVQVTTVERGGFVRGADVGRMRQGRLTVTVTAKTVAGTLIGAKIGTMAGGQVKSDTTIETVLEGGDVT